jgi:hypothetical protein
MLFLLPEYLEYDLKFVIFQLFSFSAREEFQEIGGFPRYGVATIENSLGRKAMTHCV